MNCKIDTTPDFARDLTGREGYINKVKDTKIVALMFGGLGDFYTDRQTDRQTSRTDEGRGEPLRVNESNLLLT